VSLPTRAVTLIAGVLVLAGCIGNDPAGDSTTTIPAPTTTVPATTETTAATTTTSEPTASTTEPTITTTTSVATDPSSSTTTTTTTVPTVPPVAEVESGLLCRDLNGLGYGYVDAVAYWVREGQPDRMDADRNGIPCETVYLHADVVAFWGDPLPTTTTTPARRIVYSIATHGLHPGPLPGSGVWWGSGCSPGSDTLPDGIWWGYIDEASSSSISFDLACLRWADGSDDDPATEDYGWVIENSNPKVRAVPVNPDATVTCRWVDCPPFPYPYSEWIRDGRVPHGDWGREGGLWLYINGGAITEIGDEALAG
jgi:hypothetical protein